MIGAIIGDIAGSVYEFNNIKTKEFPFFSRHGRHTDDSVMTIAIFKALQDSLPNFENLSENVVKRMQEYGRLYPHAGYAGRFQEWLYMNHPCPYNSWGNGSAMRVSSVAYFAKSLEEVKLLSKKVTEVTHNHPEGMKGAEATAVAIWMARNGKSKKEIKNYIEKNYYDLNFDYEDLRKNYTFHVGCKNSVPQAIFCFLISNSFEDAIRTGISIGGDCDTTGAIIGSIAEAFYGVPKEFEECAMKYLDSRLQEDCQQFKSLMKTNTKTKI